MRAVPALDRWGRNLGGGLVAPFALVLASGILVYFQYNLAQAQTGGVTRGDALFEGARSVHLWSSRALLAGALVHLAWQWWDLRALAAHRRTHSWGVLALGALTWAHFSGHILRWDGAGRALAASDPVLLVGLVAEPRYAGYALVAHAALAAVVALGFIAVHLATLRGARWGTPPASRSLPRNQATARWVGAAMALIILAAAIAWPAPLASADAPWPFGPVSWTATILGHATAFTASAAAAWAVAFAQPWLAVRPVAARIVQALLGVLLLAAFF